MANIFYRNALIKDGKYGIPKFVNLDFSDIPGKEFIIGDGDRLDVIAEQVYGNPSYWKAIALYNDIGYMFSISPGDIIMLPFDIQKVLERI
jgi:hypothetical protein